MPNGPVEPGKGGDMRYEVRWTQTEKNGTREERVTSFEEKREAQTLLNYIEAQASLSLVEYREIGRV